MYKLEKVPFLMVFYSDTESEEIKNQLSDWPEIFVEKNSKGNLLLRAERKTLLEFLTYLSDEAIMLLGCLNKRPHTTLQEN